jgi:D-hydroxyproline dehydrogenase subunit gamma
MPRLFPHFVLLMPDVFIDGERVSVPEFTTIAAALALKPARRSVSGEPRTAFCGMGVCHECRVTVDGRAHVLGCQTLCRDGAIIETMR